MPVDAADAVLITGVFGSGKSSVADVAANYRDADIGVFVLACFVRDLEALRAIREALGVPLRRVRLSVPLREIERRLASDALAERPAPEAAGAAE